MPNDTHDSPAADIQRRVFYFNGGFLRSKRLRRMLSLAGYDLRLGWPGAGDCVAVWGRTRHARRGEAVARQTGAALIRVEDAWLRSVRPGRLGEPPLGLLIDRTGIHFDPSAPSDLETLLATHPLSDPALLARAREGIAQIRAAHLSKYTAFDPDLPLPDPGFVLVIDQSRNDASIRHGNVGAGSFAAMLAAARAEHPDRPILIKTHPETVAGLRPGHFGPGDTDARTRLFTDPVSPQALFDRVAAVYVVSSQLGFEHILSGGRPQVFGQPFYAGWGLSDDRHPQPLPRRGRALSREQIFAAAMILYPVWYDPCRDRLCDLETVICTLHALTRAWQDDHRGWTAHGMRLWKRRPLQQVFGRFRPVRFRPDSTGTRRAMVWASRADQAPPGAVRVEDGFLRSRGLGAELIPPLSLVLDDLGIYFDPSQPSRLEALIAQRATLTPDQARRAQALQDRLVAHGLSKYNLSGGPPLDLPPGHRILVPGQVEDDASILTGAGGTVRTNLALLETVRRENPDAVLLYKPHPDVEAGLRTGQVPQDRLDALADCVLHRADPAQLLTQVDAVWTMTSLIGFEALIRGVPVTTTGAPFYAGWGLTRDLGDIPARRTARPTLAGLVHAALIDYPRYHDPVTNRPCPVEVVLERLIAGNLPSPGPANRLLAKLQGAFASYASLWR